MSALIGLAVGAVVTAAIHSTSWFSAFGGNAEGERLARMQASPNYEGGVFVNTVPTSMDMDGKMWETTREWMLGDQERVPKEAPYAVASPVEKLAAAPQSGLRITWLGHSTNLIEVDGVTILTDPVWSERVSPSSMVGVKRFHRPPLDLDALPNLDAVIISHDHYDHLDMRTIEALAATRDVHFYMPLGVGAHFARWGVDEERIHELDWWEGTTVGSVELVSTPARHFSGRSLFDRNTTLWTSWTILGPEHRVYFSGDSGYFPGFKEIGDKYGPFDVTMIEVGAYHPNWGSIHLGPDNAVKAHEDLRGKVMLPVHWGTFNLALHAWTDPMERLYELRDDKDLKLLTPIPGEPLEPTEPAANAAWWRSVQSEG